MKPSIKELDVVALLEDIPAEDLSRGDVGTIVDDPGTGIYLIEFSDRYGQTYAMPALRPEQFLVLHHIDNEKVEGADPDAKKAFDKDQAGNLKKADHNWPGLAEQKK